MRKIWILSEMPCSYRVDFFNLLEAHYGDNLTIAFLPSNHEPYKSLINASPDEPFNRISRYYNDSNFPRRAGRLMADIIRAQPDLIVANGFPLRTLPLAIYAKLTQTELYSWFGETHLSATSRGKLRFLFRKAMTQFLDGGVLYSDFARVYLDSLSGKTLRHFVLGNNTRDSRRYSDRITTNDERDLNKKVQFITVGFQSPRKNSTTILRAFDKVRQRTKNAELTIVGDGESLEDLKALRENLGTEGVSFTGKVKPDDLIDIYGKSDVLVHSALIDQWPQTHNEAAAARLAILISSTSGVWDSYMKEYADRVTFEPSDDEKLAALMLELIESPDYLVELKEAAQESAFGRDANICAKEWIEFFDR